MKEKTMELKQLICERCGFGLGRDHPWIPRVEHPVACPNCGSRLWSIKRREKEVSKDERR